MELNQDPCMPSHTLQARNYLVACFAVSLIRGETIQGRNIRYATVRNYVSAAVGLHVDRQLPSPHLAHVNYIIMVLKAIQKFEKQPNRRDMVHDEMVYQIEADRNHYSKDSIESALTDWVYLGRFVGFRGIEWCQTTQRRFLEINHPNWDGPKSYAFISEDFTFYTASRIKVSTLTTTTIITIDYVVIRFRKQKNNRNYEIIPYFRDVKKPTFCPVAAAIRIHLRAIRLHVKPEEPIGVFHCQHGRHAGLRCYITKQQVATFLQSIAMTVFHLNTTDKILNRWTSHSIRVTACNLLHRQGMSDTYIQSRLRWTSNAFLGYLRNTLYTAAAHTKALHIPANNLPNLTTEYKQVSLPSGDVVTTNAHTGTPLPRRRAREEIEQVLHAQAV